MTLKVWHAVVLVFVLCASAVNAVVVIRQHQQLGGPKTRPNDFYASYYMRRNERLHGFINRRATQREILILGFAGIAWFSGWFSATQKAKRAV